MASALLLGAALSPTDPVLAQDVQVGRPLEGNEHPVRFTLTAEAGLNDGLAFPFVYLAIHVATFGPSIGEWGPDWLLRDVLYRTAIGAIAGLAVGKLLGRVLFGIPARNPLAATHTGLAALAGVLLCYGAAELLEGYGFVAAFVAGVALRRSEERHDFHKTLHSFTENIEHVMLALLLVCLGAAMPLLWGALRWELCGIALALLFILRPAIAWASLWGVKLRPRERTVVAFYGIRGIGSIYYLSYASTRAWFGDMPQLWATVAATILVSTLVHGLTAGVAMQPFTERPLAQRSAARPHRVPHSARSSAQD